MSACVDCGASPCAFESRRCATCTRLRRNAQARDRYAADAERLRAAARERRAVEPSGFREAHRRWRQANIERERERCRAAYWAEPARGRKRAQEWAANNPGYSMRRYAANPEAKKAREFRRRAHGSVTAADLRALRAAETQCAYCLCRPADAVEHCTPICRGGSNDLSNLVMACTQCNTRKGAKTPLEFVFGWGSA